jgi:hypothetical protein
MYIKEHSPCNDIPLIRCIEKIFLAIIEAWDLAPVGRPRVNILYIFIWQTLLELLMHHDQVDFKMQVVDESDKPVKNMLKQFTSMGYKHKSKQAIKITLLTDANGVILSGDLSPANHADSSRLMFLLQKACLKAPQESKPQLIADKIYSGDPAKQVALQHGLQLITLHKMNARIKDTLRETRVLKKRNIIERIFS